MDKAQEVLGMGKTYSRSEELRRSHQDQPAPKATPLPEHKTTGDDANYSSF